MVLIVLKYPCIYIHTNICIRVYTCIIQCLYLSIDIWVEVYMCVCSGSQSEGQRSCSVFRNYSIYNNGQWSFNWRVCNNWSFSVKLQPVLHLISVSSLWEVVKEVEGEGFISHAAFKCTNIFTPPLPLSLWSWLTFPFKVNSTNILGCSAGGGQCVKTI